MTRAERFVGAGCDGYLAAHNARGLQLLIDTTVASIIRARSLYRGVPFTRGLELCRLQCWEIKLGRRWLNSIALSG